MVITPSNPGPLRCPGCGTPTVPGARFCFHCGMALRLDGAGLDEAERRVVTVLFGDLSDFTAWAEDLDPERVGEVTVRVLAALAREVADVGGRVDNLTGDGIMAVFGAPVAHEDDAERALRAAAAMQDAVRALVTDESGGRHLGLRVGINTGEVLAGVQAALTYTVIGDTVNTAARLSDSAAVGAVYAGRETVAATRSVASWRELAPLRLKGKREPVAAYELISLRPSNIDRPGAGDGAAFLGRDRDLAELARRFDETRAAREPSVIAITGEAGIGKTRLAKELADRVGVRAGARVLWGRTVRHGDGRDLAPLMDIVRTASGIGEGDSPDKVMRRVRRTVARLEHPTTGTPLPGITAERLFTLLGVRPPATVAESLPSDPVGRDDPDSVTRMIDALVDDVALVLGGLAAEAPLLLVIDDLEWATTRLWHALRRLSGRLSGPTMLLLLDREVPPVASLPCTVRLALPPLDAAASAALLRDYLGGAGLDDAASAALLGRVHGNPFFLTELLNLLIDQGVLHRADEGGAAWALGGVLPETTLPAGVQSVLAARIDSLMPGDKAILRTAAVFGVRFPVEGLAQVEQRDLPHLRIALETLADRQLVRPPRAGDPLWSFVHPMARDVAYAGLPKVERARRHAAAALWATRSMAGSPAEVAAFVGTNAERAYDLAASMALPPGDDAWASREVGFHALVRLARTAMTRHDHRGVAEILTSANRLGRGVVSEADTLAAAILHAEALTALRRLDEAERTLRPALRVTEHGPRAAAHSVLGDLRHKQNRDKEARDALLIALDESRLAGDTRLRAASLRQLGLLDYSAGRWRNAESRFTDALALARRVSDTRGVGWALQHLAWSATTRGDYPRAKEALRAASEVFQRLDDTGGLGWCAGTEALVAVLSGQLTLARKIIRDLIETAESLEDTWGLAVCLTIDALAAAELGDVTVAAEEAERAARLFPAGADTWGRALTLIARGLAARGGGDPERASAFLTAAIEAGEAGGHTMVNALAQILLGLTRLEVGDVDGAERRSARAEAMFADLDLEPHAQLGGRVLAAQVARARGRLDAAIALLEEALAAGEPATLLFPRRQAYAHLAGTLLDAGRRFEALAMARRAVETEAEDVRAQVLAWRVLGTILAAGGDLVGARAAYERALAEAGRTDAVSELPQTRRLLAALDAGPAAAMEPAGAG